VNSPKNKCIFSCASSPSLSSSLLPFCFQSIQNAIIKHPSSSLLKLYPPLLTDHSHSPWPVSLSTSAV
jgi:hypothetical protein